jgi:CheY-like chemotaxis protein
VVYAADGDEGLGAARENPPDLILLDMMLLKMSGLDVLRALKADVLVKHIRVVVLSGLGQANEAKLLKEGASGVSYEVNGIIREQFTSSDSGTARSAGWVKRLETVAAFGIKTTSCLSCARLALLSLEFAHLYAPRFGCSREVSYSMTFGGQ